MLQSDKLHGLHPQRFALSALGHGQGFFGALGHFRQSMSIKKSQSQSVERRRLHRRIMHGLRLLQHGTIVLDCLIEPAQSEVNSPPLLKDGQLLFRLVLSRELFHEFQRATVMLLSLVVGVELSRVVSCLDEVFGGPLEVPSALEVHSELGGDPRRLLAVMLEQLLSCLPMKQDAPLAHQISIKYVLIERVRKTIS